MCINVISSSGRFALPPLFGELEQRGGQACVVQQLVLFSFTVFFRADMHYAQRLLSLAKIYSSFLK